MSMQPLSTSFERALERFRQSLPPKRLKEFQEASLEDVSRTICAIEARHGSQKSMRGMVKMQGFLEAMDQYRKVVEAFLNCTPFMGYIWGPIRLILLIAEAWVTSLDTILEAYRDIGEQIPAFLHYHTLFEQYPQLRRILELYFCDILEFHQHALSLLDKPGWKKFFKSFWKTFETKFQRILDSMKRHRDLIESEKDSATLFEAQRAREVAEAHYQEQSARETKRQLNTVLEKLNAADYQSDHFAACAQRIISTSGQWIMDNDVFRKWSVPGVEGKANLFINGVPGAGKTVLASYLIDKLSEMQVANVLYFYYKHDQKGKNNLTDTLLAMLSQLARKDDIIMGYVHDVCVSKVLLNILSIYELAAATLCGQQNTYIVLDGLDECNPEDSEEIIKWFLSQQKAAEATGQGRMRLLCIGQRTDVLQRNLGDAAIIPLEITEHSDDVNAYIERQASKIIAKYEISEEVKVEMVRRVSSSANGMFLFAKLVMENLQNQINQMDVLQELKPQVFPVDVKKAYERVAATVFNGGPQQTAATQIIGWVLCAKRPLKWREIQATFFVHLETQTSNYEGRRPRDSCKRLCGSLIDLQKEDGQVEGEAVLRLVHESARFFLTHNGLISTTDQEVEVSLYCTKYLLTRPFTSRHGIVLEQNIDDGYYALLDYSASYWIDHLRDCSQQDTDGHVLSASYESLVKQTGLFLDHYKIPFSDGSHSPKGGVVFKERIGKLSHDVKARNDWKALESSIHEIRVAMESKMINHQTNNDFVAVYGPQEFKCSKIGCARFQDGFNSSVERDGHLESHNRHFCCAEASCVFHVIGFESEERLERHVDQAHRGADDESVVEFPKPPKRNDNLHKAAARGDVIAIRSLIADGHDIDKLSTRRPHLTPLMVAVAHNHLRICKLLVDHGASIVKVGQPSETSQRCDVLEHVYQSENGPIFEILLSSSRPINFFGLKAPRSDSIMFQILKTKMRSRKSELDAHKLVFSIWLGAARADRDIGLIRWLLEESGIESNFAASDWEGIVLDHAAANGHVDAVKFLTSRIDIAINCTIKRLFDLQPRVTPLMAAIGLSDENVVRELLDADKINIPTYSSYNEPILCQAARHSSTSIVQRLLQTGNFDVNDVNQAEESPLFIAADRGHGAVVSLLLATPHINVNWRNGRGQTPLCAAAQKGHKDAFSALLQNAEVDANASDTNNRAPLRLAAEHGHAEIVNTLLSMSGVDVNSIDSDGDTALSAAVEQGHAEIVQALLSAQSLDPNTTSTGGKTAIVQAVLNGHTRIIELLVADPRVDLDRIYKGDTLLMLAISRQDADTALRTIELILQAKDPQTRPSFLNTRNKIGRTALRCAVERGSVQVVRFLIGSPGIEVDKPDKSGQTPLWWAASSASLTMLCLLLESGLADPNRRNDDGVSVVENATRRFWINIVQLLSRSGKVDQDQLSDNDKVLFDRLNHMVPSVEEANQLLPQPNTGRAGSQKSQQAWGGWKFSERREEPRIT